VAASNQLPINHGKLPKIFLMRNTEGGSIPFRGISVPCAIDEAVTELAGNLLCVTRKSVRYCSPSRRWKNIRIPATVATSFWREYVANSKSKCNFLASDDIV